MNIVHLAGGHHAALPIACVADYTARLASCLAPACKRPFVQVILAWLLSISEFVLSNVLASAQRVVQEHESITLKQQDFEAFLAALDTASKPNAALKRAYKRYADQVGR